MFILKGSIMVFLTGVEFERNGRRGKCNRPKATGAQLAGRSEG